MYTYSRGTLLASSTGSRVSFASGTKDILYTISQLDLGFDKIILTGSGAPASAPPVAGAHYIDVVGNVAYVAIGDTLANEWIDITTPGNVSWGDIGGTLSNQTDLASALSAKANSSDLASYVPITRTVNGAALSSNITLTTASIADSSNKRYVTDAHLTLLGNTSGTNTGDQDLSAYALTANVVPNTRTVNGAALSSNVTLTTADIADSANKRYVTDAQLTVLGNTSGTNTGDQTISDATISLSDITTGNVTNARHGFVPKAVDDTQKFLRSDGTWATTPAAGAPNDSDVVFTDITTGNASTTKHGYLRKLDNNAAHYLDGTGAWSTPTAVLADADYGDVTVSSSGTVFTIDNDVVTYAKMQNVSATDKLLGRSTAGAGDVEEIACTAFGRSLIDDVDASAARTTLGLGTLATQSGTFSGTSSGTNTGDQDLSGYALKGANTDITSISLNQTGLVVKGATSNALTIKPNETLSAGRTLNVITGDASRTLTFAGDATISGTNTGDQDLSGYVPTSRTVNGNALSSNVTITLASLGGAASGANTDITSVLLNQTGLVVKGATSNALTIKPNETLSAARTLNIVTGDASRTLTMTGDASISGTNTGDQTISDATVSFTDITTNNSSTSKHGFLKKLDNDSTHFMDGTGAWSVPRKYANYIIPISDLTTNLTTGTAKAVFRMPGAFTVTEVRASVATQQTAGSILQFDINESGTSILSTKLTIDNSESTSTTAATAAVISDSAIADDAEITIDIDTVGTAGAKGAVITIMGYH